MRGVLYNLSPRAERVSRGLGSSLLRSNSKFYQYLCFIIYLYYLTLKIWISNKQ